jgi:hypothetical protein
MLQKEIVDEKIVNFCMKYFFAKEKAGVLNKMRLFYHERIFFFTTDFYYVLTFEFNNNIKEN